jgi:energy-converting hydrogenase Eha subunit G
MSKFAAFALVTTLMLVGIAVGVFALVTVYTQQDTLELNRILVLDVVGLALILFSGVKGGIYLMDIAEEK